MKQVKTFRTAMLLCLFMAVLTHATASSRQQGKLLVRTFVVKDFSKIKASGAFDIVFTQGATGVKVKTTAQIMEYVKVSVKGKELTLETSSPSSIRNNKDKIKVYVSAPVLEKLTVQGACEFETKELRGNEFTLSQQGATEVDIKLLRYNKVHFNVSGASDLDANVIADEFNVDASGASDMDLNVQGGNFVASISGACDLDVKFKGQLIQTTCSGAGECDLVVDCKELFAQNKGATNFTVSGNADKTVIKNEGAVSIDVSRLNK